MLKRSILIIACAVVLLVSLCACSGNLNLYLSWGLHFPEPDETEIVFTLDKMAIDGETLEIFYYKDGLKDFSLLEEITDDNIEDARRCYNRVIEDIDYDEERQNIIKEHWEGKITKGNYYGFVTDEDKPGCYLMFLYDVNSCCLYIYHWTM